MNFNYFLPGKMIGLGLIVQNKTDCEQIIELSVDEGSYTYYKEAIMDYFPETRKVKVDSFDD